MKSFRPERVASVVQAVVSEAIASKLSDPRIEPLTSVTRVEVSGDLEHAKVFVSVMADESRQRKTLQGLHSARGLIQRMLGKELTMRHVPLLAFHLDESLKKAAEIMRLIDDTMAEYQPPADESADRDAASDEPPNDRRPDSSVGESV